MEAKRKSPSRMNTTNISSTRRIGSRMNTAMPTVAIRVCGPSRASAYPMPIAADADQLHAGAELGGDQRIQVGIEAGLKKQAITAMPFAARPLAAEVQALARSARIRLDGGVPDHEVAPAAPLGLTAREFEVLRLVADGRSNPEIAARLFISAKTASAHVSNILAKIGVASRGEAAAAAHRLHLFDAVPGR